MALPLGCPVNLVDAWSVPAFLVAVQAVVHRKALIRLFRRDPPHLRGRVPVDCGVGTIVETVPPPDRADLSFAKHYGVGSEKARENLARHYFAAQQRQVTPQEMARHRNNSGPPTVFEEEALRQRPSYEAAFASARRKAERAAEETSEVAYVTPDEYVAVRVAVSMRYDPLHERESPGTETDLVLHTPHGMVRLEIAKPAPAENARRYSKEGGTW